MRQTNMIGWETSDERTFLDKEEAKDHERRLIAGKYAKNFYLPHNPMTQDIADELEAKWEDLAGMIDEMKALEEI